MRGSLLQGNGVDKMGLGVSKSWGRFLQAVQGTQPEAALQSGTWGAHTLWSSSASGKGNQQMEVQVFSILVPEIT